MGWKIHIVDAYSKSGALNLNLSWSIFLLMLIPVTIIS